MKIAVISDIHSNLQALQRALEVIDSLGVEKIHCLGDVVGYGANPKECIEIVREKCDLVIAGNHDWGAVGKTDISKFNKSARAAIEWTGEMLDFRERKYLLNLPLIEKRDDFCLAHGTPGEPEHWKYLQYSSMLPGQFAAFDSRVCFIGHSHSPVIWSDFGQKDLPENRKAFAFDENTRYIVNVGSVGQPRDGDPRLCIVIYDTDKAELEFIRANYDVETAAENIKKAGLPVNLASRLYRGY